VTGATSNLEGRWNAPLKAFIVTPANRGDLMRQRNWRLVIVGGILVVLVLGFFVFMLGMAPRSNDPKAMLETVGQVSGAVGGIALVLIVFGLIGKKT